MVFHLLGEILPGDEWETMRQVYLNRNVLEQSLNGTELQYSQKNRNHNETNT